VVIEQVEDVRSRREVLVTRPADPAYLGFLAAFSPDIRELSLAARAAVLEEAPEASELAYDAYNAVALAFTFSGRYKEAFAHVAAYAGHVNLGFNRGAELPDPSARLRGTGKAIRHVRLTAPADLADPALRALLQAAVAASRRADVATPEPSAIVKRTSGAKRRPPPSAS
jgi:hypothetical protein